MLMTIDKQFSLRQHYFGKNIFLNSLPNTLREFAVGRIRNRSIVYSQSALGIFGFDDTLITHSWHVSNSCK